MLIFPLIRCGCGKWIEYWQPQLYVLSETPLGALWTSKNWTN